MFGQINQNVRTTVESNTPILQLTTKVFQVLCVAYYQFRQRSSVAIAWFQQEKSTNDPKRKTNKKKDCKTIKL